MHLGICHKLKSRYNIESRPWEQTTNIPVFSLALVLGQKQAMRWLLYAHSPLEDRQNVVIDIPEFGKVTVDVPRAGAMFIIDKQLEKVKPITTVKVE